MKMERLVFFLFFIKIINTQCEEISTLYLRNAGELEECSLNNNKNIEFILNDNKFIFGSFDFMTGNLIFLKTINEIFLKKVYDSSKKRFHLNIIHFY